MNRRLLVAFVGVGALSGCTEIQLNALSAPPPGKTALLDAENLELSLSRGVAFAFDCMVSGTEYVGPCRGARLTSSDEGIATVFTSYLDSLAPAFDYGGDTGPRSRTAFVVVGLAPGDARLTLVTEDKDLEIDVTIEP